MSNPIHTPSIHRRQLLLGASAALLPGLATAQTTAQAAWPGKPVRIITSFAAGGATDVIARSLAGLLQASTKQTFNVDPRPGADGALAAMEALRAPADGHHLFLVTASAFSYVPNVRRNPGYNPVKDFVPLTRFMTYAFYLMVHESLPGKTLADVLAHIKGKPGQYSYASPHSTALLATAQLASSAGLDLVSAPYKGEAQAVPDLIGGRVQLMWASPAVMPALAKDGKFRPVAVLLPERSAAFPDVPTIAEAGQPLVNVVPWGGFVLPGGTPPDVAAAVGKTLREAIAHPDLKAPAEKAGLTLQASSADDMAKLIQSQIGAFAQAVKQAKVPLEN
ncbi:MAG TPA: tripartite tricarboxylate transporter substrate binding protein [Aquabacterium sp.]|nr:tripartite tricarboxylate transporter substrate binding protein [Aquabacterium sp.]HQC98002.1 tripartite tricarboxylate transporter substrate binding protein [Aquabacterium sp.]